MKCWCDMKLVKIGALWCTGCLMVNKRLKDIKEEYSNIEFIDLDYDFDEIKYEVGKVLPVLILEKDGQEVSRLVGEVSKDQIREMIEANL